MISSILHITSLKLVIVMALMVLLEEEVGLGWQLVTYKVDCFSKSKVFIADICFVGIVDMDIYVYHCIQVFSYCEQRRILI